MEASSPALGCELSAWKAPGFVPRGPVGPTALALELGLRSGLLWPRGLEDPMRDRRDRSTLPPERAGSELAHAAGAAEGGWGRLRWEGRPRPEELTATVFPLTRNHPGIVLLLQITPHSLPSPGVKLLGKSAQKCFIQFGISNMCVCVEGGYPPSTEKQNVSLAVDNSKQLSPRNGSWPVGSQLLPGEGVSECGEIQGFRKNTVKPGLCFLSCDLVAGRGGTGVTCTVPSAPCPERAVFPSWVGPCAMPIQAFLSLRWARPLLAM